MAAVFAGLDGKSGLPGWRWMYMCVPLILSAKTKLTTRAAFVVSSPFLVRSGLCLQCLNFQLEQSLIGLSFDS
jgi:hypothetical protein